MLYRTTYALVGTFLAVGLLMGGAGCGGNSQRPNSTQSGLNTLAAERLGAQIAQDVESVGDVILVHLSMAPGESSQWIKGLKKGLGGGSIIEHGPDQLPVEARGVMGGYPPLVHALKKYPNASAIVTALPVGAYENPSFPSKHPPIYALCWSYLPDSIFLFQRKHLAAGIYETADLDPTRMDPSQSAEVLFDRNYVLVTPENLREQVSKY